MRSTHFSMLALAAVSLLIIGGCMREPSRVAQAKIDVDAAGQEAIKMYDKNSDGKISGAELDAVPALRDALMNFNSNKEKGLTAADITARLKVWQDTKVGIIGSVSCKVLRTGKTLDGAEVKFVPEKFLGDVLQVASGTVKQDGNASITVPITSPEDARGVPPGWYKVEITKGAEIAPKYNTQTTLGAEVAPDVRGSDLKFEIK